MSEPNKSNKPRSWREIPPATIAFGASAREVETGLWRSMRPVLDRSKCISCLMCWVQCPDTSVMTDGEAKVSEIDLFFCKGCGICAEVCPVKAISMHPESDFSEEAKPTGHGENPGKVGEFIGS